MSDEVGAVEYSYELICCGCGSKRTGTYACGHGAEEHDTILDALPAHVDTDCPACGPLRLFVRQRNRRGPGGVSKAREQRLRSRRTNRVMGEPAS